MLSREGVYRVVGGRSATEQRVAIGAQADGRFDALIHTGTVAKTRHNYLPEPFIFPATCLYAAGSLKLGVQAAEMDMLANTFMRAPGEAVGSFALESAIDELAEQIGHGPDRAAGSATSRTRIPCPASPSPPATWSRPTGPGPSGSAGTSGTRGPGTRREGEWLIGMGIRHRDLSLSPRSRAAPRGSP